MLTHIHYSFYIVIAAFSLGACEPSNTDLWEFWNTSDPASKQKIDHSLWSEFITQNVRTDPMKINRVSYAKLSEQSKQKLNQYIDGLTNIKIRKLSKQEQLAYWINLYNALTIKVIIDHYPVQTIRDISISPNWFSVGPWGKKLVQIEGQEMSLDDIEHRVLRPIWSDPRIHYAISCAAVGCPALATETYTADNLERLLNQGAIEYINHPRGVTVSTNGLLVSSLYELFIDDFGGSDEAVLEHLSAYAKPWLKRQIKSVSKIDRYRYDWALNDTLGIRFKRQPGS